MRKTYLIFLFSLPFSLFAQTNHIVIEGKIIDAVNKPIAYATIQNIETIEGTNADIAGHYFFKTTLPVTLKVSYVGYKSEVRKIAQEQGKDTIRVDFILQADSEQLQQVLVTASYEPELVKESGSLVDFETNQHKLWLLYDYRKGDHLEVYDTGLHCLTRVILNRHSENINVTPHNFLYTENSDSVRLFQFNKINNSIHESALNKDKFQASLSSLIAFHSPSYYYLLNGLDSSNISYWCFNNITQKRTILYSYKNPVLSRDNKSILQELGYSHILLYPMQDQQYALQSTPVVPIAMSETGESGNSGLAFRDQAPKNSREFEDSIMQDKIMFHSILCPLRIVRDSIYIFNFDNDTIYVYDLNNSRIRELPLSFYVNGMRYKNRDIMVDEEGNECYYKFEIRGSCYLQKIDLNTGKKINTRKLGFPFPEKIRVMAGYVYYSYSDIQNNQMFIRHLYRQKIN